VASEPDARLSLALDEGRRAITQQRDDLDRLRGRSVALVSVASVAASVLGGLGLPKTGATIPQLTFFSLGLLSFTVLVGLVCWLLKPVELTFENDASVIAGWATEGVHTYDIDEVNAELAKYMAEQFKSNRVVLNGLYEAYQRAIVALGAVVVCLAVALGLGAG
jgi:hypothetical protein